MEYSEAELRSFIGPRATYYLKRFQRLQHGGPNSFSFNFAAFFFSLGWLLYRRLHRIFWIALAIVVVESVLSEWVATAFLGLQTASTTYNQLVTLTYAVTVGTFANALYYRHAARRLAGLKANAATEGQIAQAGGVRWGPPLVFLAVVLSLVILAIYAGSNITAP
ncbi:MAG TPA: DUF2628 domain-containing protein [Gemmatimonadales bacterium]|nr:DUF2628 domain-containing protein [Gemmatimonadales bacterium]